MRGGGVVTTVGRLVAATPQRQRVVGAPPSARQLSTTIAGRTREEDVPDSESTELTRPPDRIRPNARGGIGNCRGSILRARGNRDPVKTFMSSRCKHLLRIGVSCAAAALAVNGIRVVVVRATAQVRSESAFTVVLKETVTGRDGKARVASTQTCAVRSDGSTLIKLGASETGSRLIWFASGIEVMTNDRLRLKSTVRKPESPPSRNPGSGCTSPGITNEKSWGEQTVEGYRAAKVTSGAKDRALTTWYALDHGCAKVKSSMGFETGDRSELRLVSLIAGEPEAALFDVPGDYQEGPPSALAGPAAAERCGPPCQEHWKRRDAEYYKHRP
jgi:hypothetical protein